MPIEAIVANRHKIRVTLLLLTLVLLLVTLTVGTLTPVSPSLAHELYDQVGSIPFTPESIFFHNIVVCLLEMIPLLGILMIFVSGLATGLGLSSISVVEGFDAPWALWQLLNQYPHTWLEFLAYTLAATEGTMAFLMLIAVGNRLLFKRELKILALTFLVTNLLLTVGAVFETASRGRNELVMAAMWIPLGAVLVAALYYDAKRRGMKLPNPLIPLALVEVGTIAGFALPTLLVFAVLLWIKHFKFRGRVWDDKSRATLAKLDVAEQRPTQESSRVSCKPSCERELESLPPLEKEKRSV